MDNKTLKRIKDINNRMLNICFSISFNQNLTIKAHNEIKEIESWLYDKDKEYKVMRENIKG